MATPGLNESPSQKEEKSDGSMSSSVINHLPLNESPSEKEGKLAIWDVHTGIVREPQ